MTLGRGNVLIKVDGNGDPIKGESYHEFEVVELTSTQSLAGLLGPERVEKNGGATEPMGEVYQLVLLRVRD